MKAETTGTRSKCANCFTSLVETSSGGDCGNDLMNYQHRRTQNQTQVTTLTRKIHGKDEKVQVADALSQVYRLDWFLKIQGTEEGHRNDLNLCLDCFIVFSQMYRLFFEFQLLRKTESVLSERLETINSVVDLLLASSSNANLDGKLHCDVLTGWNDNGTKSGELPETYYGITDDGVNDEQLDDVGSTPTSFLSLLDHNSSTNRRKFELNEEALSSSNKLSELSPQPDLQAVDDGSEEILGLDCGQRAGKESRFEDVNPKLRMYECVDCEDNFKTVTELGTHRTKVHRSKEVYKCHICMKVVNKKDKLRRHMKVHWSTRPYKCKICSASFPEISNVKRHIIGVHEMSVKNNWEVVKLSSDVIEPSKKSVKSSSFSSTPVPLSSFSNSNSNASPSSSPYFDPLLVYKCSNCTEAFATAQDLGEHRLTLHNSEEPYNCRFRKRHPPRRKCYRGARNLRRKYEKAYPCSFCTQNFSSNVELAHHLTSAHVVDFSFQCTVCSNLFDNLEDWTAHATTHLEFQCLVCRKTFSCRKRLLSHQRTHTEDKNYCCGICYKDFKLAVYILKHVQTMHRGLRANYHNLFMCKMCKAGFSDLKDLKIHLEVHTDPARDEIYSKNLFTCKDCNTSFGSIRNLKLHSLMHSRSDSHPFYCKHCGDNFKTTRALKIHHQQIHAKHDLQLDLAYAIGRQRGRTNLYPEGPSLQQSFSSNVPVINEGRRDGQSFPSGDNSKMTRAFKMHHQQIQSKHDLQLDLAYALRSQRVRTSLYQEQSSLQQSFSSNIPPAVYEGSHGQSFSSPPPLELMPFVFKSTDCEEPFDSAATLDAHRSSVHQAVDLYKCHICLQSLSDSGNLRIHMTEHVTVGVRDDVQNTADPGNFVQVKLCAEEEEFEESEVMTCD